jgi:hypothetical protein
MCQWVIFFCVDHCKPIHICFYTGCHGCQVMSWWSRKFTPQQTKVFKSNQILADRPKKLWNGLDMKHDIQKWSPGWVRLAPRPKASQHPLRCNCAGVAARRPVRLKWFGLGVGAAAKNPRDLTPRDNSNSVGHVLRLWILILPGNDQLGDIINYKIL